MFEIHPSAEENINYKVCSLLGKIEAIPMEEGVDQKFETELHSAMTISDKDIIGDIKQQSSDYRGNTVARYFAHNGVRHGLEEDSHKSLVDIAEKIQRLPAFRNRLSQKFIEDTIFSWLIDSFIGNKNKQSFLTILSEKSAKSVKPTTVYVPIANMMVQRPFLFCGVVVCNITKEFVNEIVAATEPTNDEEHKNRVSVFFEKFRKDFQGFAAIKIELECESGFANDLAIMTAETVTSFLGIYSHAMLIPDVKCISKIKGSENLAQSTTISRTDENGLSMAQGILDKASLRLWRISEADVSDYSKRGLGILSEIFLKNKPTEFELLVLNASTLYSKAAFTSEPLEKLVYILSALESTLLKNENESIQQNLAERLAIFTSQKLTERKAIVKSVKSVYGLRSRYLHHGHTSVELEGIAEFMEHVWLFYIKMLGASRTFADKAEFLESIDDHKLS